MNPLTSLVLLYTERRNMNKYRKEQYITQRQQKNGLWSFLVRIRTEDDEICKSFNEKDYPSPRIAFESALQFRNRTLYELANKEYIKHNDSTVNDMFDYYLENTTDSYKTKSYHQKLYNKYIHHKDKKIQSLTKADIQEDLNKMVEIASDDTISRVFSMYKNDIIGSALLQDIVSKNITLGVKKPNSHMNTTKRETFTDRETLLKVEDLILHSVVSHYDAKVIITLLETLYYTGMRPAEVEVLTRKDIKRDYISVTKELGSSLDEDNVVRRPKNPKSIRNVPIHPNLKPMLKELMEFAKKDELFKRESGEYMSSTWIGNIIRRLCKKEGIEFNMYRLRHNMATNLVTNKIDSITTMELLGHSSYNMSLYYANSNDDLKKDAIELFS